MNTRRPGDHDRYIATLVVRRVAEMIDHGRAIRRPVPIGASWASLQAEANKRGHRITQAALGEWFAEKITSEKP